MSNSTIPPQRRYGSPRRAIPLSAAFVLLAAVAGCASVGPNFEIADVDAPSHWSDRHGGPATLTAPDTSIRALPSDRWALFEDAELTRLQALALQANQDVKAAALRLLQSRVEETTVSAQRGVQSAAQGGFSRQRQSEFGTSSRLVSAIGGANKQQLLNVLAAPYTLYQAGFDASWEPDLWGRVLRSEEAARANTDAQRATLRLVHLSVTAELARSYFLLRSAQRQQLLIQGELAAAKEMERLLRAQRDNGLGDESMVIRQRSQVSSLRSLVPALLAQETLATNQITLLCGAEPGALNDELAASPMSNVTAVLPDFRFGLPSELARRRPDVAAAEARLHAATANIGIAVADLYPRVTLGASFGFETVGSEKLGSWGGRQWSVGPSLSIPVFDQGRRRSTIHLRELQQQEAAVAFQQTVLKAWHEVDDAISVYVSETQRSVEFAERVANGRVDVGLAQARYANGLTTYMPVLSANTTLLEAQRDLTDSTARLQTALTALYKALGDGGES